MYNNVMKGQLVTLRPLHASDFEELSDCASDPLIWQQHPDRHRHKKDSFKQRFFDGAVQSHSAYVILCNLEHKIVGSTRYYDFSAEKREIAIGYTFLSRRVWGTGVNAEVKSLMFSYIRPYADAVWFHIGAKNQRSRAAVEKLGAVYQFSERETLKDSSFEKCYYRLVLSDIKDNL